MHIEYDECGNAVYRVRSKESGRLEVIAEDEFRYNMASELAKLRRDRGITQREYAEIIGVGQSTISKLETGRFSPNIHTILRYLVPLGKTLYIGDLQ